MEMPDKSKKVKVYLLQIITNDLSDNVITRPKIFFRDVFLDRDKAQGLIEIAYTKAERKGEVVVSLCIHSFLASEETLDNWANIILDLKTPLAKKISKLKEILEPEDEFTTEHLPVAKKWRSDIQPEDDTRPCVVKPRAVLLSRYNPMALELVDNDIIVKPKTEPTSVAYIIEFVVQKGDDLKVKTFVSPLFTDEASLASWMENYLSKYERLKFVSLFKIYHSDITLLLQDYSDILTNGKIYFSDKVLRLSTKYRMELIELPETLKECCNA